MVVDIAIDYFLVEPVNLFVSHKHSKFGGNYAKE
jgi:hypothetical protein